MICLGLLLIPYFVNHSLFLQDLVIQGSAPDFASSLTASNLVQDSSFSSISERIHDFEATGFGDALTSVINSILASGRCVFLYFYAEWCHFCQLETPIIDDLDTTFSDAMVFIRVNHALNPEALETFNVNGFPTMLIIYDKGVDGYVSESLSGFQEKSVLEDIINMILRGEFTFQNVDSDSGTGLSESCSPPLPHYSCSFTKCYEDCILERFYPTDPLGTALTAGKVQQAITDFLTNCLGLDKQTSEALDEALSWSKKSACAYKFYEAQKTDDPRAWGEAARCAWQKAWDEVFDQLGPPGDVAKCALALWSALGDLLVPHSDCIAECAGHPSTWSKNWGHPCRDNRSPELWKCLGPAKAQYGCKNCEWVLEQTVPCPPFYECVMTSTGPVCEEKCDPIGCDDGDPCTIDWCTNTEGCKHDRTPGCDHPDENEAVSTSLLGGNDVLYEDPEIGVLSNGFSPYLVSLLTSLGKSTGLLDGSLQGIENFPVVIIPSGGLSGLDSSLNFVSRLEDYVQAGGTLIVFTQQHGYEYQALPGGEIEGYGWLEDQSCQYSSVTISTYHPIFAGQNKITLNMNVDGFFTSYPENSTILLTRTKNAMPTMLLYNYGKGRVLATTLYSDMASALHQRTSDETVLVRDIVEWAKQKATVQSFAPGSIQVSINVTNPYFGPLEYPIPEFTIGATVSIPINVTNKGDVATDEVAFALFDPVSTLTWVNITETIPVNQSKLVTVTLSTNDASRSGIWSVLYLLSANGKVVFSNFGGEFALNYSINALSQLEGFVTVFDPQNTVVTTVKNVSMYILPGNWGSLNVSLNAQTLGVWTAQYSVLQDDRTVLVSARSRFAVSELKKVVEGWVYQESNVTFAVTSDSERYAYGSNASFIIHIWNDGDDDENITVWWSFPHNHDAQGLDMYGSPGTTRPGEVSTLVKTLLVPAHDEASFQYSVPVYSFDRLWAEFYDGKGTYLGRASRGFYTFAPLVEIQVETDQTEYARSETVTLSLQFFNQQSARQNTTVTLRILDPHSLKVFEEQFTFSLAASSVHNEDVTFTLPVDAEYGTYIVTVEAYHNRGYKSGSATTYFTLSKDYFVEIEFDQPNSVYRTRQDLTVSINATNLGDSALLFSLNTSIPSLAFYDEAELTVDPTGTASHHYPFTVPATLPAGTHHVLVSFSAVRQGSFYDSASLSDAFLIPQSKLIYELDTTEYAAGDDVVITLTNIGGVDAEYEYSLLLLDLYLDTVFTDAQSNELQAGDQVHFTYPLPAGSINGTYFLKLIVHNRDTDEQISTIESLTVHGLGASLTSQTDAVVYSTEDVINLLTTIINLGEEITAATLDLYILSTEPVGPQTCVIPHDDLYITEDTVLCPGVYNIADGGYDGVIIIKADGVVLEGNDTVLMGSGSSTGVYNYGFDEVTIRNLEIHDYYLGLWLWNVQNNTLENLVFQDTKNGIYAESCDNTIITNTIANSSENYGLQIWGSDNNIITNNIFANNKNGFSIGNSYSNLVANNTILDNSDYGIVIGSDCRSNTLTHNSLEGNGLAGLSIYGSYNTIVDNVVNGETYYHLVNEHDLVLEDLELTADAVSNLGKISLINCTNLTLRNLTLTNNYRSGLYLYQSTFITIENITVQSNKYGIYLISSYNNTLKNNIVGNNREAYQLGGGYGIAMDSANFNALVNNTIIVNQRAGLYLKYSTENTILHNSITSNDWYGIHLEYATNNLITDNVVYENKYNGIYLSYSTFNVLTNNTVTSSGYGVTSGEHDQGINLYHSDYNDVSHNIVNSNRDSGIYLEYASNNTLTANTANGNGFAGIRMVYSENTTVTQNNASLNGWYGIIITTVVGHSDNLITDNIINANSEDGLSLSGPGHIVINNVLTGNSRYGIALGSGATDLVLSQNQIEGSGVAGFSFASGTYYNTIVDNVVNGETYYHLVNEHDLVLEDLELTADAVSNLGKISLINCTNLTLRNLTLTNNYRSGLYLYQSRFVTITNITATSNDGHGIYLTASHNNTITLTNASFNNPSSYGYGIYHSNSNNNTITGNTLNNNFYGLYLTNSNGNSLSNNTVLSNYYGITVQQSSENLLVNNTVKFSSTYGYGISLQESSNYNTLLNNTFCSNGQIDIQTIYSSSENWGIDNTCSLSPNWNDEGQTGCTYPCPEIGNGASYALTTNHCPSCTPLPQPLEPSDISEPPMQKLELTELAPLQVIAPAVDPVTAEMSGSNPPSSGTPLTLYGGVSSTAVSNDDNVVWSTSLNVDVVDSANIPSNVGSLDVTGKLYLYAVLRSSSGQVIAYSVYPFYVTEQDYALTLATDKTVYRPGETVKISGVVENYGTARTFMLTVQANDAALYTDDITLETGANHPFTTTTTATSSFTLIGIVDDLTVTDYVRVESPTLDVTLIAPDTVGTDEFEVTVSIENMGNVSAHLQVQFNGESFDVMVPAGALTYVKQSMSITATTTVPVTISGDITLALSATIAFGGEAELTLTPVEVYIEGLVDVPYLISNTGIMDMTFDVIFSTSGDIVTREVFLPAGGNITDHLTFNLVKGMHVLECTSPFWDERITLNVEGEPQFILTEYPENMTFDLGEKGNYLVSVKNIGGKEGEVRLRIESPGLFDVMNRTWLAAGQETNVIFTLPIPDDVEEKSYDLNLEVNGERYETTIFIRGAKVSVDADLDQQLYEEGDNATLTLTLTNLRDLNLTLYSRVKLGDYDAVQYFNLSGLESTALTFMVPVVFDAGKMLYTVYLTSGRALYINSLYIHPQPPESAGITMYTDKQVYEIGDTVTISVNATRTGRLTLSAPDYDLNITVTAGVTTYTFDLPALGSGTYPIEYQFDDYASTYPIDVIGYSGRILSTVLNEKSYLTGDTVTIQLIIDVNKGFEGFVNASVLDPSSQIVGAAGVNHTFTVGENRVELSTVLNTNSTGLHAVIFELYAYGSTIFLASGARYFDAVFVDLVSPVMVHVPVTEGMENEPIEISTMVSDNVIVTAVYLFYRIAGESDYTKLVMEKCAGCIDTYRVTIPASEVRPPSVEYFINATDGTYFTMDGTPSNPHLITVASIFPWMPIGIIVIAGAAGLTITLFYLRRRQQSPLGTRTSPYGDSAS